MRTWQAVARAALPVNQIVSGLSHSSGRTSSGTEKDVLRQAASAARLQQIAQGVFSAWQWLQRRRTAQLASRRLRITETVSLGEKRFVSIVQVDGVQFLIGAASGSVSLLAKLGHDDSSDSESMSIVSSAGPAA